MVVEKLRGFVLHLDELFLRCGEHLIGFDLSRDDRAHDRERALLQSSFLLHRWLPFHRNDKTSNGAGGTEQKRERSRRRSRSRR